MTDRFIAVAPEHGRHLVQHERFPQHKVRVISNGVDTQRFRPMETAGQAVRRDLGIDPDAPVCGIVAALRPEKNIERLLAAFRTVVSQVPRAQLVIVGDGPERHRMTSMVQQTGLHDQVRFLGARRDIPEVLNALDIFALSSRMEANPVSILEALSCGIPVVAPHVGSIPDTVRHNVTGRLAVPLDGNDLAGHLVELLVDRSLARQMGQVGRQDVLKHWTLQHMVDGYTHLIQEVYTSKVPRPVPELSATPMHVATKRPADGDPPLGRSRTPIEAGGTADGSTGDLAEPTAQVPR